MKKTLFLLLFLWQTALFAQNTFVGILEYEVTVRINRDNLPAEAANNPNIPDAFNFNQKLYVNGNEAKQEIIWSFPTRAGNQFRRFMPEFFFNLAEKKMSVVNNIPRDTVNFDKYVVEKSYAATPDLKFDNKKTKKIAGLNCKKATLRTKDDEFTIWYTTELGFTYSPLALGSEAMGRAWGMGRRGGNQQNNIQFPAILIENAVIVSVEGSEIGYDLKNVSKENVEPSFVKVPADAQKVTDEELAEIFKSRRGNYRFQTGGRN
jgi:GLPGLI family protein